MSADPNRQPRKRATAPPSTGGEPYSLKRGDCGKSRYRDEWTLLVKDPSIMGFMSRQTLSRKLLKAAKIISSHATPI